MSKTLKIFAILLMTVMVVFTTNTQMVFASGATAVLDDVKTQINNTQVDATTTQGLTKMAGSIINLIRVATAIAAVILIAVFGFKFIMGSANEKADYTKSFIPLIVGVVVVFSSTYIAELLFKTFGA